MDIIYTLKELSSNYFHKNQNKKTKSYIEYLLLRPEVMPDQTEHGKHIYLHTLFFPSSNFSCLDFVSFEISLRKDFFVSGPETDNRK